MNDAVRICTRLVTTGPIRREDLLELDHPQIRAEVEQNLRSCGMCLATSAYSDYYGLQLVPEIADATVLDAPTNLGLGANACALLTILWARLALQHRTAEDTQGVPNEQIPLLPQQRRNQAKNFQPSVRFETLAREFGEQLGGRTRLHVLVSQLRRLGFLSYRKLDEIQAGPLLELAIDGERMISFIRSRVLGQLLTQSKPADGKSNACEQQVNEKRTPAPTSKAPSNKNDNEGTDQRVTGAG
jgi:hypothetical protein